MKRWEDEPLYKQLIHSRRWLKKRTAYIKEHPLCENCGKLAEEVHHIRPLNEFRNDPHMMEMMCFDDDNLQSLCKECHLQAHIELGKFKNRDFQAINKEKVQNFIKNWL